jgi:hypothetical protein
MASLTYDYVIKMEQCLPLPITHIDGVKTSVILENGEGFHKEDFIRLSINVINGDARANRVAHNQEEFEEMIEYLKNLKFDKVHNQFVDARKRELTTAEFYEILKSPTITMANECCVCLEMTRGKIANCKHTICMRCVSNLVKDRCPMCRERIMTRDCGYESSDEEE